MYVCGNVRMYVYREKESEAGIESGKGGMRERERESAREPRQLQRAFARA